MSDSFEEQEWVRVGVAGAMARQYAADQRQFLEELARMLESALPGEAEVGYRGGLFSRKTVQRVSVTLGDNRYTLEDPGRGPLRALRTHVVRGIALKSEPLPVEQWLEELGAGLDQLAATNAAAREALGRFVG